MLYKILGVWLIFSLWSMMYSQDTFEIKGFVRNANTLEPIEGANIIGETLFSISSVTGEFIMKDVPQGTYTFTVTHLGYSPKTVSVTAGSDLDHIQVYLNESSMSLEGVAVYGKSKRRLDKEAPTISHLVTKDFLDRNRENSLMQTLEKIPGVSTITIGSGQSKPVIRGLGFNRVVVVQNGVKHEAQQWGHDHGLEIDQYGIENIQIIKGPASLVYGSDAIAGVLDIRPNGIPLKNSLDGEVNILGESNNSLFGVSAGIKARKDKWFYRGRFTYRDYGDYKVPTDRINYDSYIFELYDNNLRNTAGREANASLSVGYASENLKSETFFSNVNAKNGFFANAHGLEVRTSKIDYDHSNRDIDLPFHEVNHFKIMNNTSYTNGNHTLHLDLGFQNNHRREHSEPVPHGYMPKPPNSLERVFNKNTYTLNLRGDVKPNEQWNIVLGTNAELQYNRIGGWGYLIPAYNRLTMGAFAYSQFEVHPQLHVLGGIRYDYGRMAVISYYDWYPTKKNNPDGTTSYVHLQRAQNKIMDFGNISASAGVSYLMGNTTFKVNLGKSFRMPLSNELASDGLNYHMYRYEKGNLDLKPEVSYQLDLEVSHKKSQFSMGFSPFANHFENYIYLNPTSSFYETLQIYEYTQTKVLRYGGELWAGMGITKDLQMEASLEYVQSKQTKGPKKGFTLPFSPPLSAVLSANYQFSDLAFLKSPSLMTDFRMTASQNKIIPPEKKTEGHQIMNITFLTDINGFEKDMPIQMKIKLNNIFHTKYYDHTSYYRLIDVPEAGRNLSLSITVPF